MAASALRAALQAVDPRQAVHVAPLADRYREEIAAERLLAVSLAVLGGSTLLLSVFGIVALVGQLVTDRSRALALRLVLGSSRTAIVGLAMRGVIVPALAGTAAGLVLAWWDVGLIRQFLFETPPYDVTQWALAVAALLTAALAGAWWPARRALRIDRPDPPRALRGPGRPLSGELKRAVLPPPRPGEWGADGARPHLLTLTREEDCRRATDFGPDEEFRFVASPRPAPSDAVLTGPKWRESLRSSRRGAAYNAAT